MSRQFTEWVKSLDDSAPRGVSQMQRPQRIEISPHKPVAFEGLRSKMACNLDLCLVAVVFVAVVTYCLWLVVLS